MSSVRLDLEYDGTEFAGWARQPDHRTIQDELERVLASLLGAAVPIVVAGRTDRGVHATGQVCSYVGEPVAVGAFNRLLPDDLAVTAVHQMPGGWNARRDARSRAYRYRVLARPARSAFEPHRVLHVSRPLDRAALDACAAAIVGVHDFTAFTPTETLHSHFRRTVSRAAWVDESEDVLAFEIEADTFLRHMNRVLVGTMLEVGSGRRTVKEFVALLAGAPRDTAGPTAAPHGLCLVGVRYDGE